MNCIECGKTVVRTQFILHLGFPVCIHCAEKKTRWKFDRASGTKKGDFAFLHRKDVKPTETEIYCASCNVALCDNFITTRFGELLCEDCVREAA